MIFSSKASHLLSLCSLFRIFVNESCRQTRFYLALVTDDLEFRFLVNIFCRLLPLLFTSTWSSCVCKISALHEKEYRKYLYYSRAEQLQNRVVNSRVFAIHIHVTLSDVFSAISLSHVAMKLFRVRWNSARCLLSGNLSLDRTCAWKLFRKNNIELDSKQKSLKRKFCKLLWEKLNIEGKVAK